MFKKRFFIFSSTSKLLPCKQGPTIATISSLFLLIIFNFFTAFEIILFKQPLQPECKAQIKVFLVSYINIGAQSAVSIASEIFLSIVILPSALIDLLIL